MRIAGLLLVVVFTARGFAAFERTPSGARGAGMGGALVALAGDEWSGMFNPGALQTVHQRALSLVYAPQPFGMKELAFGAVAYVEPTALGAFGLAASRFGFELYHETRFVLSYANELARGVYAGASVSYYALSIRSYGSASALGADLGVLVDVTDQVRWGVGVSNLTASAIGKAKEKLPQVFTTGLAYTPMIGAVLAAGITKDVRFPAELHFGIEYTMLDVLDIRAGTTSDPNTLNAGVGVRVAIARFDYAFSSHSELGMSHQVSLSLQLGD